jgi:hypothetical protein
VVAFLDDPSAFEHQDAIGGTHAREPVGDQHDGVALGETAHLLEDLVLAAGIERRRRFVEDQHRGIAEVRPCQGDALPLSRREVAAPDEGRTQQES